MTRKTAIMGMIFIAVMLIMYLLGALLPKTEGCEKRTVYYWISPFGFQYRAGVQMDKARDAAQGRPLVQRLECRPDQDDMGSSTIRSKK